MYVFDVLIKSLLDMSYRLLVACDEMRKRHLIINKINDKTSKTTKKAKCDVNVGTKESMPNIVHALLSDVQQKLASLHTWVPSHVALNLVNGMQKCTKTNIEQLTSFTLFDVGILCSYGIYRTNSRHHSTIQATMTP